MFPQPIGWTSVLLGRFAAVEHPFAIGFTDDGERLVTIDHAMEVVIGVLDQGELIECREDGAEDYPEGSTTFGYPTCDGRAVRYSSFNVQDLPLEAPGGWRLETRDPHTSSYALYICGPEPPLRLVHLGEGWGDTFIGGFSPCGRYLVVRDFGCPVLFARDAAFGKATGD